MALIDVTVVLLDGGLPSTSMAPLEIFGCAGVLWSMIMGKPAEPRFRIRTATIDGRSVGNFVPVTLAPTVALRDVHRTDLVFVPTAGMDLERAREHNADLIDWLAHRRRKETTIAAVCTGVTLLAAAGLLDGRTATTHWGMVDRCRELYPNVRWTADRLIAQSGNIFSGGGLYASLDLSLHLVERYCGHAVAVETAKALLLESPRIWQTPYAAQPPGAAHDDEPIQRAQKWLAVHYREVVDVDSLAAKVGMSPRNFARRFKAATGDTALAYLHRLRIDRARRQLENSPRSIHEISEEVGYEDIAFFRMLFRRYTGTSPREYRARFGPRRVA